MADISDIAISQAYNDVRDDNTPTNWLILSYESDKNDKLVVSATGTGGLSEFVDNLTKDQANFGYVRINISNDDLSQRSKFLLVSWCGSEVKVLRRAKLSVHIANVKSVIKNFAVEISASEKNDLREADVLLLLKKAMGANYDRQSTTY